MVNRLAIDGGTPVRSTFLPYGQQWIEKDDIEAVVEVLSSDWLTTGPNVARFEEEFAERFGPAKAVAVSSGTAALHAAMYALGAGPDREVIVPAMTFVATANCALFQGAVPIIVDVDPESLLIDPNSIEEKITEQTIAVIAVDFTGHPCDYDRLREICDSRNLALVDDASHALGATYKGRNVGSLADLNTFSFHPVKHVTSGEGGMITTEDEELAAAMARFRNHNISREFDQHELEGTWYYEVVDLGFNYRLTDFQCALARNQLSKLDRWLERRRRIAGSYDEAFQELETVRPLAVSPEVEHAYHLYVVALDLDNLAVGRTQIFVALRAEGIGVNVHYIPVHLHPYYKQRLGTGPGLCPVAEDAYERIISLPIFPKMTDSDIESVIEAVGKVTAAYSK